MRKSYLGLALSICLPFLVAGCADNNEKKQSTNKPAKEAPKPAKSTLPDEAKARLELKKQIANCLQVSESKVTEPLERFIGDDIFDLQGQNDNQEFIRIVKKVINDEIKDQKLKQPITKEVIDYDALILERSYTNFLKRISSKVMVDQDTIARGISKDVFSRIMFEFNHGTALNQNIDQCLNIYKDYNEAAYNYFVQTTSNERIKAVGVQKVNPNGNYTDDKGIRRNSWDFRTISNQIKIQEKPIKLLVDDEVQDIPISNDNWKNQNKLWANLDRLWVDQVFVNKNEIYIVLAPDSNALGLTPQVFFREVIVLSLGGKVRERFSYKYPFDLKTSEEISVTPTGFVSRTKESNVNGVFSAVYQDGRLSLNQLALTGIQKLNARHSCSEMFEKIYLNEVNFKRGLRFGEIPEIPENLKPLLSERIKSNLELEKEFFHEVSNKSLVEKLDAPKGYFEKKYCD